MTREIVSFRPLSRNILFHSNSLGNLNDVTVEWVETAIFNPTFKVSILGLEIAISTCSTGIGKQIFKRRYEKEMEENKWKEARINDLRPFLY